MVEFGPWSSGQVRDIVLAGNAITCPTFWHESRKAEAARTASAYTQRIQSSTSNEPFVNRSGNGGHPIVYAKLR